MIGHDLAAFVLCITAEGIKHQERVEPALQTLCQYPFELDPRTAARATPGNQLLEMARLADRGVVKGQSHRSVQGGVTGRRRRPGKLPGDG
jgi:hypothetical protein